MLNFPRLYISTGLYTVTSKKTAVIILNVAITCNFIQVNITGNQVSPTHIQSYPPPKTEPHPAATGRTKQQNATTAIKPSRNNDPLQKAPSKEEET
jgi:hypothetical protein